MSDNPESPSSDEVLAILVFDPALDLTSVNAAWLSVATAEILEVVGAYASVRISGVVIGVPVAGLDTVVAEVRQWLISHSTTP